MQEVMGIRLSLWLGLAALLLILLLVAFRPGGQSTGGEPETVVGSLPPARDNVSPSSNGSMQAEWPVLPSALPPEAEEQAPAPRTQARISRPVSAGAELPDFVRLAGPAPREGDLGLPPSPGRPE